MRQVAALWFIKAEFGYSKHKDIFPEGCFILIYAFPSALEGLAQYNSKS